MAPGSGLVSDTGNSARVGALFDIVEKGDRLRMHVRADQFSGGLHERFTKNRLQYAHLRFGQQLVHERDG